MDQILEILLRNAFGADTATLQEAIQQLERQQRLDLYASTALMILCLLLVGIVLYQQYRIERIERRLRTAKTGDSVPLTV